MVKRLVYGTVVLMSVLNLLSGCLHESPSDSRQTVNQTASQGSALTLLDIEVFARNEAPGETNTVKPRIYLRNASSSPLTGFEVHYFFRVDPGKTPVLEDYYTPLSTPSLDNLALDNVGDGLWRVVYDYGGYTLNPGALTDSNTPPAGNVVGLRYTDWSLWNKADDWSYQGMTGGFSPTDFIVVVDADGNPVAGEAPPGVFDSAPSEEDASTPSGDASTPPPPAPPTAERVWFTVNVPDTFTPAEVALGSSVELHVKDYAKVFSSSGSSFAPVTNVGHGATTTGVWTKTGSVFGGGSTSVGASFVYGNITSAGSLLVNPGAFVTGTTHPPFTEFDTVHQSFSTLFPTAATELPDLASGQTFAIEPGSYGPLAAYGGETFELEAGTYFFDSVLFELGSTFRIVNDDGPVFIFVRDGFTFRGLLQKTNEQAFNVLVAQVGSSNVEIQKPFRATVIAPQAKVSLRTPHAGAVHKGAYFGRTVVLDPHAQLYHRPLQLDCEDEAALCRSSLACPLSDEDGDAIPDCEEEADDNPWTSPVEPNGMITRWDDTCSYQAGSVCAAIDTLAEVDVCLGSTPRAQQVLMSGWDWDVALSSDICDPSYGFVPPWAECGSGWTLHSEGQMHIEEAGNHCFAIRTDGESDSCGALYFDGATDGVTSDDGVACFELTPGVYPIRWFRAAASGATSGISVEHCYTNEESCLPDTAIPADALRPDGCGDGECFAACPCDLDEGPCTSDEDCAGDLVCPEAGGQCSDQACAENPNLPECNFCDPAVGCGVGQTCRDGVHYGYPSTVGVCVPDGGCEVPEPDCGQVDSLCGFCECIPNCAEKECGDDTDDGCGGTCVAFCAEGSGPCVSDPECVEGTACIEGVCLDTSCATSDCDPAVCGDCGQCVETCGGNQCGDDGCGGLCGLCSEGSSCADGMCLPDSLDRPEFPPHPGVDLEGAGDDSIGTLDGTFAVSPQGRAGYHVPLNVPLGRGGVQPNVSLSYSGTTTPGIAGVGWNLNASSQITRCRKTVAVDGWPGPITGDDDDAYCLDGQRLILISGSPLTHGAKYRTEVESFNDITYLDVYGVSHWRVQTKDGESWLYGRDFRSYMIRVSESGEPGYPVPTTWPVTEKRNRALVSTHYSYECRGGSSALPGGPWCTDDPTLVSIEYGQRSLADTPTATRQLHRIKFNYDDRESPYSGYGGANVSRQGLKERLGSISMYYANERIRQYLLTYGDETDFLTSVQECVPSLNGDSCLNPTTFEYADDLTPVFSDPVSDLVTRVPETFAGGPIEKDESQLRAQAKAKPTIVLDANGDGLTDFLFEHSGSWWLMRGIDLGSFQRFEVPVAVEPDIEFSCISSASVADVNLDGRSDLVSACPYTPPGTSQVGALVWHGTDSSEQPFVPIYYAIQAAAAEMIFPMDANGDGRSDLMACGYGQGSELSILGADGIEQTIAIPNSPTPVAFSCNWQHSVPHDVPAPMVLDVDGDGVVNWILRDGGSGVFALALESVTGQASPVATWKNLNVELGGFSPNRYGAIRPLDLNGDGLHDSVNHVEYLVDGATRKRLSDAELDPTLKGINASVVFGQSGFRMQKLAALIPRVEEWIFQIPEIPAPLSTAEKDPYIGVTAAFWDTIRVLDYDRDGRDDLLGLVDNESLKSWVVVKDAHPGRSNRSVAIDFAAHTVPELPTDDRWLKEGTYPMFADFDSDGATDALFYQGNEVEGGEMLMYRGSQPERGLLSKVTDGLGNHVSIEYASDSDVYTPALVCDTPNVRCLPRAGVLVHTVSTFDSTAAQEGSTLYSYTDARMGGFGRGPLGFRTRTVTEFNANGDLLRSTIEEYDNGQVHDADTKRYPFAGRLTKKTTVTGPVQSGVTDDPSEELPFSHFKTEVTSQYVDLVSDAGRPFTMPLRTDTVQSQLLASEVVLSHTSVTHEVPGEGLGYDWYGNVKYQRTEHRGPDGSLAHNVEVWNWYYPRGQRNDDMSPDPDLWEVGLLQYRSVESQGVARQTGYDYDTETGQLETSTRFGPANLSTTVVRDNFGNVIQTLTVGDGIGKEVNFTYDPYGLRIMSATGPTGLEAHVQLDPATGRLLAERDVNGRVTQHRYDYFGRKTQTLTATGMVETRLLPTESPEPAVYKVERTVVDGSGPDATEAFSEAFYDSRGRAFLSRWTGLDGTLIEQRSTFNSRGLLEAQELPHPQGSPPSGSTMYFYDHLGSLIEVETPGDDGEPSAVERYQYGTIHSTSAAILPTDPDALARTVFVARKFDADGEVTTTFSGSLQEAVLRRKGTGTGAEETIMEYGPFGQVSRYKATSNAMDIDYDLWGRVTSVTDSDIGTTTYTYDAYDRVQTMVDADGRMSSYEYDLLDRLRVATHPDSEERFVYDRDLQAEANGEPPTQNSLGRPVRSERETPNGTFTELYRYEDVPGTGDPLQNRGLLERVRMLTPTQEFEISYEYVPNSARVLAQHYPESSPGQSFGVRFCYDAFGSRTHVFDAQAAVDCTAPDTGPAPYWKRTSIKNGLVEDGYELGNGVTVQMAFDPNTYRLAGHSIEATNTTIGFSYGYEPGGRLKTEDRAGDAYYSRTHSYYPSGVLQSVSTASGGTSEVYTPAYNDQLQLTAGPADLGTFSYQGADESPVGNRLKQVDGLPDENGNPTPATTFDYDGRGNQILRTGPTIVGGQQAITYNNFNLPDSITTGTGGAASTVAFDYNAAGSRVHTVEAESETWHFASVYEKTEAATDPDVEEEHRYWVFARGKRLVQVTRTLGPSGWNESSDYFHYDRQGSVIAMTDAMRITTGEFTYGLYGEPEQQLSTAYGYTGHRHEQALGLIDMGGRFYDPKFGVFLSADPVSPFGGGSPRMNRYAYVGYDPVNFIDPSGRFLVPLFSSWIMQGAIIAALPAAFNYVVTGEFSYDWSKETWAAAATIGASVAAGAGCGSLAAATGPGAAVIAGFCAGAVGGGVGAGLAGANTHDIVGSAIMGAWTGAASGALGAGISTSAFAISSNPYIHAGITVTATSGANVGVQYLTTGQVDWAMVAAQTTVSALMAFYGAAERVEAAKAAQAAQERGQAAGRAYSEASGDPSGRGQAIAQAAGGRASRSGMLVSALANPDRGENLTCSYVDCVAGTEAPADVVRRARRWLYPTPPGGAVNYEVGETVVVDAGGGVASRRAINFADVNAGRASSQLLPGGRNSVQFTGNPSDTIVQHNHTHLGHHSPHPSVQDFMVSLSTTTPMTTYHPSGTLNILWHQPGAGWVQTFVSPLFGGP